MSKKQPHLVQFWMTFEEIQQLNVLTSYTFFSREEVIRRTIDGLTCRESGYNYVDPICTGLYHIYGNQAQLKDIMLCRGIPGAEQILKDINDIHNLEGRFMVSLMQEENQEKYKKEVEEYEENCECY